MLHIKKFQAYKCIKLPALKQIESDKYTELKKIIKINWIRNFLKKKSYIYTQIFIKMKIETI